MRLGKVAFERVFEESCGSAFGNPAVQRVGHPGWLQHPKTVQLREHVRRRTDLLSQTLTLGRSHLEWASLATTSIPTCIPYSGFAQQIGEGTQKAQKGAAKGTKNCLFCVPHCAFCGSSPFVGHGSLLHDLRQVGPNAAKA